MASGGLHFILLHTPLSVAPSHARPFDVGPGGADPGPGLRERELERETDANWHGAHRTKLFPIVGGVLLVAQSTAQPPPAEQQFDGHGPERQCGIVYEQPVEAGEWVLVVDATEDVDESCLRSCGHHPGE